MIYTPFVCIDMLKHRYGGRGIVTNPTVTTKIEYKGFEISISMDSSHQPGDLTRSDIRVFAAPGAMPGVDCTCSFLEGDETILRGEAETLLRIMKKIEGMNRAERTVFAHFPKAFNDVKENLK